MEITDFVNRIQQAVTSTEVRTIAQRVKSMLATGCRRSEIEVDNEDFAQIIEHTMATPTSASVFNFIRITDSADDNSVDIQTIK